MSHQYLCTECYGGQVNPERARALIRNGSPITCIECGDKLAKQKAKSFTVAIPFNKGAYQYIHNPKDMVITNPKRTT